MSDQAPKIPDATPLPDYTQGERQTLLVEDLGRTWLLNRTADMEAIWENMSRVEFGEDERMPYWAELWPASLLLVRWLTRNREAVRGRVCLDIGCGLGLSAIVASWLGAKVVAMDHQWPAVYFSRENAALNGVGQPLWTQMDWCAPAFKPGAFDFMWAGDIVYETRFYHPPDQTVPRPPGSGGQDLAGRAQAQRVPARVGAPGRGRLRGPFAVHRTRARGRLPGHGQPLAIDPSLGKEHPMGKTIRFGVSLNSELLEKFDQLCEEKSYSNRSEAIRDLIRGVLVQKEWESTDTEIAAVLSLVYDHHVSDLAQRLIEIQHEEHAVILTTVHVHLDHHNCLEVLILKGPGEAIRNLSQKLISTKGVKHGKLTLTTTGQDLV